MSHGGLICFISFLRIFYNQTYRHEVCTVSESVKKEPFTRPFTNRTPSFFSGFNSACVSKSERLWGLSAASNDQEKGSASLEFVSLPYSWHMCAGLKRPIQALLLMACMRATKPQFILYTVCGQCMVRQQKVILPGRIERSKGSEWPSACTLMQHRGADLWYHDYTNIGWIRSQEVGELFHKCASSAVKLGNADIRKEEVKSQVEQAVSWWIKTYSRRRGHPRWL